jgi:hypothetical protein
VLTRWKNSIFPRSLRHERKRQRCILQRVFNIVPIPGDLIDRPQSLLAWSLLNSTKAPLSPNLASETSDAYVIFAGAYSMRAVLCTADISEFMNPLSEMSAEYASY